ncbi:MAG: DUF3969 family protein [Desulfobacterales bacterium]
MIKNQIERMLCHLCIGLLTSLLKKEISLREAEQLLFSPFTNEYLKENKISEDVTDIIHRGCELEDIESLIPEKFDIKVKKLIERASEVLKKLPEIDFQEPTWFSLLILEKMKPDRVPE